MSGARTCNLVNRPDFDGFGFSMRCNDKGPHQISNVELESPAHYSGLKSDDYVLRVNDVDVVGERYNKTVALIKNESEKGRLKLEVIEPHLTPYEIRNVGLSSNYDTLTSNKGGTLSKKDKKKKDQSIDNLRQIAGEVIGTGSIRMNDEDRSRAVSLDTTDSRKQRPFSMSDIDRVPHNSTVRSNNSYGSTATAFSEMHTNNLATNSSKSATNLNSASLAKPKFKRCVVQLLPDFKGYGFTLNSKVKPKYCIYTIDSNSPAYKANLRETDVIVQIDKKNIRRQKFDKVKALLSDSQKKGHVEILAIDREGYMYYKNRKKRFSSNKLVTLENVEGFSTIGIADGRLSSTEPEQPLAAQSENQAPSSQSIGDMPMRAPNYQEDELANSPEITQAVAPANGVTSASSSKVQITPLDAVVTGTELDNQELLKFTVVRETGKPLGLALSSTTNRSVSRSSSKSGSKSKSKKKKDSALPIITSVEAGSPVAVSGLRPNDLVIEINGKATSGESNKKVGDWIKGSGNTIEFLVSREKKLNGMETGVEQEISINADSNNNNAAIRENARLVAEEAMNATRDQLVEDELQNNSQRMSRKDSAQLSQRSSKENSRPATPKVINSEIRMSSSRLHQEGVDDVIFQVTAGSGNNNPRFEIE